MYVATWHGAALAAGADVIEVERSLYFRAADVRRDHLRASPERSVCEWKGGEAEYYDVLVGDRVNPGAAWSYPRTGPAASALAGRFAFWRGVAVAWVGPGPTPAPQRFEAKTPNVAKAIGASAVVWRPSLPEALAKAGAGHGFSGYLIADPRVLVEVIATPADAEREGRIAAARAFGRAVDAWNTAHPSEAYGYVAVWGSATPDPTTLEALRDGRIVLALTSPAEILPV